MSHKWYQATTIKKYFCSFLYLRAFFGKFDMFHLFWESYVNSCHFELYSSRIRSFPAILSKFEKWSFLAENPCFFRENRKKREWILLHFYQNIEKTFKNIKNDKINVFLSILMFLVSSIIFIRQSKSRKFRFLRKKHGFLG